MDTEMGVIQVQAKEFWQPPKAERDKEQILSQSLQREHGPTTP